MDQIGSLSPEERKQQERALKIIQLEMQDHSW